MSDPSITTLLAEAEIRRVLSFYGDAVCRKDAEAIRDLFTPEAQVQIAGGPVRTGRDEIVEGLRRTMTEFTFLHQVRDTGLVVVEGDTARARVAVYEVNRLAGTDQVNLIFGTYEDEFSVCEEHWRFSRRNFTLRFRGVLSTNEVQEFPGLTDRFVLENSAV